MPADRSYVDCTLGPEFFCVLFPLMPCLSAMTKFLSRLFYPRQNQNCPAHTFCPWLNGWFFAIIVIQNAFSLRKNSYATGKSHWLDKKFLLDNFNFVLNKTSWQKFCLVRRMGYYFRIQFNFFTAFHFINLLYVKGRMVNSLPIHYIIPWFNKPFSLSIRILHSLILCPPFICKLLFSPIHSLQAARDETMMNSIAN